MIMEKRECFFLAVWTGQIAVAQMLYIQTITILKESSPPPTPLSVEYVDYQAFVNYFKVRLLIIQI